MDLLDLLLFYTKSRGNLLVMVNLVLARWFLMWNLKLKPRRKMFPVWWPCILRVSKYWSRDCKLSSSCHLLWRHHQTKLLHGISHRKNIKWHVPNSLRDSNVSPNWKQRKRKKSGHVLWLAALYGGWRGVLELWDGTRKNWQASTANTNLHKTNTRWLVHSWSTFGVRTNHGELGLTRLTTA